MALLGGSPFGLLPMGGGAPPAYTGAHYAAFLKALYPDSHNLEGPVYTTLLNAIGAALDQFDPFQLGLQREFSVTTALGAALDANGRDWGVPRRLGEADNVYRARILAMLATYASGASDPGIGAVVTPFTGAAPIIVDCSSDGWICTVSAPADSGMADLAGVFTLYIYVQNPLGVAYSHLDMEQAVRRGLPTRGRAFIWHAGVDTSTLGEAADAIATIV